MFCQNIRRMSIAKSLQCFNPQTEIFVSQTSKSKTKLSSDSFVNLLTKILIHTQMIY